MSQSNFVQPLLNSPMDPFAQQAMEEERRYKEAQQQMLRGQRREDFQVEQGMRGEAAQERLAMELEARRKAAKKDLKMRRGFQLDDDETKRGYAETDLANQRIYNLEQSNLMAGELPELREKIRAKGMQLSDLQNNILVDTLSPNSSQEALETTQRINEDFLASLFAQGVITNPPPPGQRGSIISSTSTFLNWLKGQANGQMPLENVESSITAYRQHVGKAKQAALQDPRMANQILSINGTLRQLQGREATILAKVQGGGIDYNAYTSGVLPTPRVNPSQLNAAQPQNIVNALDELNEFPSMEDPVDLARLKLGQSNTQQINGGSSAFEAVEDMNDVLPDGWGEDDGGEFQQALDVADTIGDDTEAVNYLLGLRKNLNESIAGSEQDIQDKLTDNLDGGPWDAFANKLVGEEGSLLSTVAGFADPFQDWMTSGYRIPVNRDPDAPRERMGGLINDAQLRNVFDVPSLDEIGEMNKGQKGAYASLNGYIENKLATRDPDGSIQMNLQTPPTQP